MDWRQRKAFEGMIAARYQPHHADSDVNLAAFHQGKQVRAHRFGKLDLYVRSLFGVLVQECGGRRRVTGTISGTGAIAPRRRCRAARRGGAKSTPARL
jgi:hypothetical protein